MYKLLFAFHSVFLLCIYGCNTGQTGEQLARQNCGSCHVFTEPNLLPKSVWLKKVLPNMATRMGFALEYPYSKLPTNDVQAVMAAHVIPDQPVITQDEMWKIVQYYSENAPEKPLPQNRKIKPQPNFSLFDVKTFSEKNFNSSNILLKKNQNDFLFSFEDKGTFQVDVKNKKYNYLKNLIATDFSVWKNKFYALNISTIEAHNLPKDEIWEYEILFGKVVDKPKKILEGLIRPVSLAVADINKDLSPDFLICEFGDYLGSLTLFESNNKAYKKIVLRQQPGACKAFFKDINNDGIEDIVALMSQGKEEVVIFDGAKNYLEEISVAVFPPSYGLNAMKIIDIDKDGKDEIVITNGDNADISSSLKNYHGVRILKNQGNFKFNEKWFYPVFGASELEIEDFDKDGDIDFFVLSHFSDFSQLKEENLIYFENEGSFKFIPKTLNKQLNGRPLTITKNDIDNDGDMDVLIGNHVDYLTSPGLNRISQWQKEKIAYWILENKLKE